MDIIGQQVIPASREAVWTALNDPVILKACLPGCESVECLSPDVFQVVIKTAIGPLRARFEGSLKMTDVMAPESCVMHFEGQGGAVGFGKGTAVVLLRETADGTELSYEAKAQIGGKLAQVGSRLIDSVAKKMADDFFKAFRQQLLPPEPKVEFKPAADADADAVAVAGLPAGPVLSEPETSAQAQAPMAAGHVAGALTSPTEHVPMVPAWWLAPAAVLGAALVIAGANLIR
jgi:carbon monoxide dehydrogenase subunit G